MTQRIRLWKVAEATAPIEIPNSEVGLEKRLEDWLERNIAMLDPGLLVVGRQVQTPSGRIDLLCIDREGLIVVVELKKGQTRREVVAQALDYASWVKDLNTEKVEKIAKECRKIESDGSLQQAFVEKFDEERDDLCEGHRSIIVAEAIDDSTERIVRYLSELGVPINIARMHAFKDSSGQEMLAQVFLVEPEIARDRARSSSSLTASQRAYKRFWTKFLPMSRDAGNRQSITDSWMSFGAGRNGISYHAGFAGRHRHRLRTGVYIDTGNKETTKEVFDKLHDQKQKIEQSIGESLEWDRLDHRQGSRISLYFNGDMLFNDEKRWPPAMKWLVSAMDKMREAFGPVIQEL